MRGNTWTNRGHKAGEEVEHQNQKDGRAKKRKKKRGRGRHRNKQNTQRKAKSERADGKIKRPGLRITLRAVMVQGAVTLRRQGRGEKQ